ncbi:DNA polymerase III subunit beta [Nocardiopsis sp. N85]|uniref:DNA polymerase III subunit beta n=1 Tax=Nocardiopsis sp. N85 TaxID=3029400 RepID=UPI00237FAFB6|nr:DNA polymerase III subunit beta [Nocardiopsis sp. N85]MDE3724760.1 DNA polymerase III subunit beta [Nocardiopsis sp. N85]
MSGTTKATRTTTLSGAAGHLAEQIGWIASHLPTRPAIPILTGMRLQTTDDGWVNAHGTDHRVWAVADLDTDTDGPLDVVVPGRLLASLLVTLPRHLIVTLAIDPDQVRIACGPTRASIRTLPAEDYPEAPAWPEPVGVLDATHLAEAASRIVGAATTDESLPMLQGIHLTLAAQGAMLAATDRYRFAVATAPWTPTLDGEERERTALVPARTLHQAAKALARSETVTVGLNEKGDMIGLSGDGRRITTTLIDHEFPTWERTRKLLPETDVEVDADITDLIESVKRVSLFAESATPVRITITEPGLVVRAGTDEIAAAAADVDARVEADHELVIAMNPTFLAEALTSLPGSRVRFSIGPADRAVLIRPADEEETGLMWMLMPVRQ